MKNKIIFEFNLNSEFKLIAYEDPDYEELYLDSYLCFRDKNNVNIELLNDSFVYAFGMDMYIRLFNINEFSGNDIIEYLEIQLNDFDCLYNPYDYHKYIFAHCANDNALLLYKMKDYHFVHVQYTRNQVTKKYKAKKILDIVVNETQLESWQKSFEKEFSTRARYEAKRALNQTYDNTEWNKYLELLKDEKKDYFNTNVVSE